MCCWCWVFIICYLIFVEICHWSFVIRYDGTHRQYDKSRASATDEQLMFSRMTTGIATANYKGKAD